MLYSVLSKTIIGGITIEGLDLRSEDHEDLEQLCDDELIEMIKNGNDYPFAILFHRYYALVKKITSNYYLKSFDTDDFMQEAQMIFNKTIHTYDKTKGHTFGNFFKLNLKHHFYSLIRKDMAKKRSLERSSQSLDELTEKGERFNDPETETPIDDILHVRERLSQYHQSLSLLEQMVFYHFIRNKDVEEIASFLEQDATKIRNALDRCKRKMKALLE